MYTENEFILKINSNRIKDICTLAKMTSTSALAQRLRESVTEVRSAEGSNNYSKTLNKGELKLNNAFSKEITSRGDRGTVLLF